MTCVIASPTLDSIRSHAAAEYPREGCGLLVGRDLAGERAVEYAVPTRNADATARRYAIPPEEFLVAERAARERGLEVVGFYHSHPDVEPAPSATDTAAAWPHYTYLIVGVEAGKSGEVTAWRLAPDGFVAEPLRQPAPTNGRET